MENNELIAFDEIELRINSFNNDDDWRFFDWHFLLKEWKRFDWLLLILYLYNGGALKFNISEGGISIQWPLFAIHLKVKHVSPQNLIDHQHNDFKKNLNWKNHQGDVERQTKSLFLPTRRRYWYSRIYWWIVCRLRIKRRKNEN